jgi:hypothetical protein
MLDKHLERHIIDCGRLMQDAYARYEVSGCFSDRGEADGWRLCMESAIASRSPAAVAAMETEASLGSD